MARGPTIAQLAAGFIADLKASGLEIYRQDSQNGIEIFTYLYILPKGQGGANTSIPELLTKIQEWLHQKGIVKEVSTMKRITKTVLANVEHRQL